MGAVVSSAESRSVLDALPDAFFVVRDEHLAWVSVAGAAMLGASTEELVGKPFAALCAPGEAQRLETMREQRRAGWHLPATFRMRFVRPGDGVEVPADVRFGESSEGLVVSARDVTEVRRAEALMGQLASLSSVIDSTAGVDALLDACAPALLELGWTAAYSEVHDRTVRVLRIVSPPDHALGEYGRSLVGHELPLESTPIVAECVSQRRPIFLDNIPTFLGGPASRAVAFDQSMRRARITRSVWCPIWRGDRITHVFAVGGADITEHDFVALQLFAAQLGATAAMVDLRAELVRQERLAAVGEMSAVLAHEVRNPLAVIFNALGGLRRTAGEASELLDIVTEEAERLRRLMAELLEFARPTAPQLQPLFLPPVVAEAIDAALLDPACPPSRPQPDVEIPVDTPPVEADPELLRRAVVNMLVNAFVHVPTGGRVAIRAEKVAGSGVRLIVYNDGEPIEPKLAARIFEPFFTTRPKGSGLGLPVVRRIVQGFGGRVELDSTREGVQFSVFLRSAERAPALTPAPPSP